MSTLRTQLRREISTNLIPVIKGRGFDGPDSIKGNSILHEFSKQEDYRKLHLSIQMEKHQKPRFIISLDIEPSCGYDEFYKVGGTLEQGRLRQKNGKSTASWFRADHTFFEKLVKKKYNKTKFAVESCISFFDEVDGWWTEPKQTQHIDYLSLNFSGTSNDK